MADPPGMKRVLCWGVVGIEVGSRLGAREPVSELDPEVPSTPIAPRPIVAPGARLLEFVNGISPPTARQGGP